MKRIFAFIALVLLLAACAQKADLAKENVDIEEKNEEAVEPQPDTAADNDAEVDAPMQPEPGAPTETEPAPAQEAAAGITVDELAMHSSNSDCWVVFEGKVYDITSFLPKHPGGINAIARYCGSEKFEDSFMRKHGTSKVGMFMEKTIFVGNLA